MNWIRVKDKLPKKRDIVIGYDQYYGHIGECHIAPWNPERLVFLKSEDCDITHWQPLPDPPAEALTDDSEDPQLTSMREDLNINPT